MNVKEWLGESNTIGQDIWEHKYRFNNETFDEWVTRVSGNDKDLARLIKEKKFLFGGRALANRGTGRKGSLNNCYSAGFVEDNIEYIMNLNSDLALTFKAQGGQGISMSRVRPKGTPVGKDFVSDGIVPFMEIFNTTTSSISQGGARKGALMISLDIRHKEAPTFITIKTNEDKITKANLSLEIDDEFMTAVQEYYLNGKTITLHERRTYSGHVVEYDIVPIELYKLMMKTVYDWAEPGCIFTEQFRNYNMMQYCKDYQIETCNPCGEQPLKKHTSCNLGSLNLSEFVKEPYTKKAYFDKVGFALAVHTAVKALDDIIDENLMNHPLEEQRQNARDYRNIGLGAFGYANMLFKLGMTYGSEEAIKFTKTLFKEFFKESVMASIALAKIKGSFPKCKPSLIAQSDILQELLEEDPMLKEDLLKYGLRNCSLLSIAPNGSIATLLGLSGGCEPEFALKYTRHTDNLKDSYDIYCKSVQEYWEVTGVDHNKPLPEYFVTSADIPWKNRIDTQAAMQKYIDTAISSTVNLKKETTQEEIESLYLYAWSSGLKGVTIYRSGCKREGILVIEQPEEVKESRVTSENLPRGFVIDPDNGSIGKRRKLMTGCGSLHVSAFFDPITGELLETYLSKGSTGGCNNFMIGLSRMISLASRGGVPIDEIIDQLNSCGACPSYAVRSATKHDTSKGACCPMAVGNALREMYEEIRSDLGLDEEDYDEEIIEVEVPTSNNKINKQAICPVCGEPLVFEGGCNVCKACGYSKCD